MKYNKKNALTKKIVFQLKCVCVWKRMWMTEKTLTMHALTKQGELKEM
jgi:hypothetical protein